MRHGLSNLVRHRALIQSLVARELKARYRGSVFGYLWSFFNPLLLLAVYFLYGAVGNRLHSFMSNFEPYYSAAAQGGAREQEGANGDSNTEVARHTVINEDYDQAIALAKAEKKKLLVNFTGVT